uniref:Rhodanese domain-containing protein n=1 Tax=Cyclophora tenuis TaxID=216820 RepID=A0A7S1D809_CYCTE
MRLGRLSLLACLATRRASSFVPLNKLATNESIKKLSCRDSTTCRFSSGGSGVDGTVSLKHVGRVEMKAIVEDYEELGREGSGFIVMDVRNPDEINYTGKLSPNTLTVPLPAIMQMNLFELEAKEFEEVCGFAKPMLEETIVFSCAAGIRSVHAANIAAQAGYSNLVNYMGGANEWFSPS